MVNLSKYQRMSIKKIFQFAQEDVLQTALFSLRKDRPSVMGVLKKMAPAVTFDSIPFLVTVKVVCRLVYL